MQTWKHEGRFKVRKTYGNLLLLFFKKNHLLNIHTANFPLEDHETGKIKTIPLPLVNKQAWKMGKTGSNGWKTEFWANL